MSWGCDGSWTTHRDDEHGFAVSLPTDWPVDEEVDGCVLVCVEPPPAGTAPTYLPPSIVVTIDELPDDEPFNSWLSRFRVSLAESYDKLRLIDLEDTSLGDAPAYRTLFHYLHGVVGGVCTDQWCIPAPGRVYVVTCSSGALEYDDFADTFRGVAGGFRLTTR
ncbi:MAG: hypothetical protein M3445_06635 [Actinomycetota bacterium]|nr:hypothetical protein [Actinomycetota bacterium]